MRVSEEFLTDCRIEQTSKKTLIEEKRSRDAQKNLGASLSKQRQGKSKQEERGAIWTSKTGGAGSKNSSKKESDEKKLRNKVSLIEEDD